MWLLVAIFGFITYYDHKDTILAQIVNILMIIGFAMIPFYFTAYFLVPKLLYKKKFTAFIIWFVVTVVVMGLISLFCIRIVYNLYHHESTIIPSWRKLGPSVNLFIWNNILAAFCSSGLKILSDRFRIEKKLHEVEEEKITTELSFLRSQINPHFLFNIMNTIYFQIEKTNAEARLSVEKFSEMLRYQLYECTTDKIQISQELNYIKNYIAIQTLRMEKDSDIKLLIDDKIGDFWIAPFLILPIVENAFKHVSNFKESYRNKIHVELKIQDDHIFQVEANNTYEQDHKEKHLLQSGGLGIQNLKRRLELLYPERYELNINNEGNTYRTVLKLQYDN
ncbi:MAG: sensor histidine kinase [Mucilaginibacter sp.]